MATTRWLTILIVCIIFSFIMSPIEAAIKRRFSKKWQAYTISILIGIIVIYLLYGIAYLLGFKISE